LSSQEAELAQTVIQSEVLEDLNEAWRYRRWLAGLARPWLGDHPIELGSGLGDYVAEWLPSVSGITASESDPGRLARLKERYAADPRVDVRELRLPSDHRGEHTGAVALNVLEHIAEDVDAVRNMAELVRPGGHVAILVPAFQFAMSRFDRTIGHVRRYTKASLREVLVQAGTEPVDIRYVNAIGLINWTVVVRGLRVTPRNGVLLRAFDRLVVPVMSRVEARVAPPFGQSVFAVARTRA
jgi:SAM-dependent methyltransferase